MQLLSLRVVFIILMKRIVLKIIINVLTGYSGERLIILESSNSKRLYIFITVENS